MRGREDWLDPASTAAATGRAAILAQLRDLGRDGDMTRAELERAVGMRINIVCARVAELATDGIGHVRSRRKCHVTGYYVEALAATPMWKPRQLGLPAFESGRRPR